MHHEAITCQVEHKELKKEWIVTVVYGMNKIEERERGLFWTYLKEVKNIIGEIPWVALRAINAIQNGNEKIWSTKYDFNSMLEFNQCIEEIDVQEHPNRGFF